MASLPLSQRLLVDKYTGSGSDVKLEILSLFGGYPKDKAILPWMPASGMALLSLKADQKDQYFYTLVNEPGEPYAGAKYTTAEYYVRE